VDAFGPPQTILGGQALNQTDHLRGHLRTTTPRARFEFPEQAKSLAMPTQQSIRFEDEQDLFPIREAAGQKDEPQAVGGGEAGFLDLTVEDDQLLPELGILSNQLGFTVR
jgi:hypothetical protein